MKKIRSLLPLVVLLIVVLIGIALVIRHKNSNFIENQLAAGNKVILPQFSLPELYNSSKNVTASDLLGHYSIINVFASWCSSCRLEHNLFLQLDKNNSKNNLKIYGVAWLDMPENSKRYLKENGNPYFVVMTDNKGVFSKILGVMAAPESFIINPSGQIIYYQKGLIDQDFISFVESLK